MKDQVSVSPNYSNEFENGGNLGGSLFAAECEAYGFSISSDWQPYRSQSFVKSFELKLHGGKSHYQTDMQQVLLKNINYFGVYAIAYRVVMSPISHSRNWGFLGIGSHSDDWYVRGVNTNVQVSNGYSIGTWAPKNTASSTSGTIGVDYGTQGFTISASVDFTISQLELTSKTNVALGYYETDYSVSGKNNYSRYSSDYYGFFTFIGPASLPMPSISINHEVKYFGSEYFGLKTHSYEIEL